MTFVFALPLEQANGKSNCKTSSRSSHGHVSTDGAAGALSSTSAVGAVAGAAAVARGSALGLDDAGADSAGVLALVGSLGVLAELDVGAVVQSRAAGARGDNLQRGQLAVGDVLGPGQVREAQRALARRVGQVGRQADVEVGRVGAEAEVDKDVRPRVVKLQLDGGAGERDVGDVASLVRDAGAYD